VRDHYPKVCRAKGEGLTWQGSSPEIGKMERGVLGRAVGAGMVESIMERWGGDGEGQASVPLEGVIG